MLENDSVTRSAARSVFFAGLIAVLMSACGLRMDTQDRLNRAQQAFDDSEYRAAIIDAKNVLMEEPENVAARLLLGRASVEVGDGMLAEKELRRAVELGTAPEAVIVDLGQALLLQGKFDDVIAEISPDLVTSDSARLAVSRLRGDALIGLQQFAAARALYQTVLVADSEDIAVQLGVVNSYIGERNYAQARESLNQVLAFNDSYSPAWLISGSLSMRVRDASRAERDYDRALNLASAQSDSAGEMQALFGLADSVLVQNKPDNARPVLARMLEIAPRDDRTLLISARLAASDEDWTSAQENLQEILRRLPDYRPAQMLLGVVHKENGNLGQAEMYLSAVVTATPDNSNARRLLAETRIELDKADEARRTLDPIVSGSDADARSLSMAAGVSLTLGDFDDAIVLLQRGVEANPENIDLQIQLAFTYLNSGNAREAQKLLQRLPAATTARNEFRHDSLLILTQLAKGHGEQALQDARRLLARWPGRPEAHILLGLIEMSSGDYVSARNSFDSSRKLAPSDIQSIRYLAQLDEAENALRSAKDRYLVILDLQPNDIWSMIALARLAVRSEQHDEARDWLEKARDSDEAAIAPRAVLGSFHLAYKEFAGAEEVITEAIELDPDNAKLRNILGVAQLNQENYRGAVNSFKQAMKLDPVEPSYRLNVAQAQAEQGSDAAAMDTLQQSMDQSLQHIPSAALLASLKADAGDLDGAKAIAGQLRKLHPDEAAPHALEAELLARGGDLPEAAAAFDRASNIENLRNFAIRAHQLRDQAGVANPVEPLQNFLRERPLDSNMRIYLAQAYQGLQETGNANAEYERVLMDEPDNFIAANNLAWNYFMTGDPRAEEMARQAYDIQPDNSSIVDTLGWILVKKGALQDGILILRNAAELGNNRPEIRFHLAAGLAASGATEESKNILQEILTAEDPFESRQKAEDLLSKL